MRASFCLLQFILSDKQNALLNDEMIIQIKNPPANAGNAKDGGSIPGWGRTSGGVNGNPLQYSYLENPMDRGVWRAAVRGVTDTTEAT